MSFWAWGGDFSCISHATIAPDPPPSPPILGNGTEDIVRRYPNPSRIFFFSLHLYDKDSVPGYEFFPGSGASDDTVHNIINVPIMPKWHEQQGGKETATNVLSGREAYRQAITQRLLPALRAFNPDLILLSTGFDPVDGDVGNTRSGTSDGKAGMDLQPHDFQWVTAEILKIADICCSGRVVSVLEGGYGQYAIEARGVAPQVRHIFWSCLFWKIGAVLISLSPLSPFSLRRHQEMDRGILATAAIAHIHSLVDPFHSASH